MPFTCMYRQTVPESVLYKNKGITVPHCMIYSVHVCVLGNDD